MTGEVRAADLGLVLCRTCERVAASTDLAGDSRCPRCGFEIDARLRGTDASIAWLVAAVILYIPANTLPVMHTDGIAGAADSTIFSGIVAFWQGGSVGIAALIFAASVAVPLTKFAAIGLLLFSVHHTPHWAIRQRARLYRAVEFIGYWSMLDVVVIAITSALLQFKALGTAEPRTGIAFFCAVVVATMLAARCFDPRLIWTRIAVRGAS